MTTAELSRPPLTARLRVRTSTTAWPIAALTVAAAALRFSTLGVQSFWKDEAVTVVRILHPSLFDTLSKLPHSEATPPLYYVLAWVWTRVFGAGEVGIRSLSALIGTATVPVVFLAAERLVSRRAAIAAAAVTAFSPYLVWYSQEARAYALLALLAALSLLAFLAARARPTARNLACWALASALALATHYFAVFFVAAEALWLVATLPAARRAVAAALAAVGVVGLALLPLALHQERGGHDGWIHQLSLASRVANTAKLWLGGTVSTPPALPALAAGAFVLAALWLLAVNPEALRRVAPALIIAAAAIGIPLVLSIVGIDYLFHRNVIGGYPALAVVLGAGLGTRRAGPALAVLLCGAFLAAVIASDTQARYQRADWRAVAHAIGPAHGPRAVVTPSLGDEPLELYLGHLRLSHRGARVGEIDAVGWALAGRGPRPAPPGFHVVERGRVGAFTFVRYRASEPLSVGHPVLAALHVGVEHPGVLITAGAAP